jgi:hypothetical protein
LLSLIYQKTKHSPRERIYKNELEDCSMCVMKMMNCPQCGKPLTKEKDTSRYSCENEECSVVYVRYPGNPFVRKVTFASSVREETIRRIEEVTAQEISHARSIQLSRV